MSEKSHQAGFTLIELLVSLAIFGILLVMLTQFLVNFMNMKFNAEATQRIRQEGNYALDQIDYLIRNSMTLPDLCMSPTPTGTSTQQLRTMTLDPATGKLQRNQVFLENNQIKLRQDMSGANKFNSAAFAAIAPINFTSTTGGSGTNLPFKVEALSFGCNKNTFTNGYLVTTKFTITYGRKTLGSTQPEIKETFERATAVRNINPFEN